MKASDYTIESGIDTENAKPCENTYNMFEYIGDCINTVDEDDRWDATEMSSMLYDSDILEREQMVGKLCGGDRDLPEDMVERFENGEGEFYCGICEYAGIAWIYDAENDIHHFFEASL